MHIRLAASQAGSEATTASAEESPESLHETTPQTFPLFSGSHPPDSPILDLHVYVRFIRATSRSDQASIALSAIRSIRANPSSSQSIFRAVNKWVSMMRFDH